MNVIIFKSKIRIFTLCILVFSSIVNIAIAQSIPMISNVKILGEALYNNSNEYTTLTASYTFKDVERHQNISSIKWYRGSSADGVSKQLIADQTSYRYILTDADKGKYIFISVTPTDNVDGAGTEVFSDGKFVSSTDIRDKDWQADATISSQRSDLNVWLKNNRFLTVNGTAPSIIYTIYGDFTGQGSKISVKEGDSLIIKGALVIENNLDITVDKGAKMIVESRLIAKNGAALKISGELIVNGNVDVEKNAGFVIDEGGSMEIDGDLLAGTNAIVHIDGDVAIGGNVEIVSGDVTVDGSLDIGGDFTGNVDVEGGGTITVGGIVEGIDDINKIITPIVLTSFQATLLSSETRISFSTLSEQNFDYFSIERSADAKNYVSIGTVKGSGYSAEKKDYSFVDLDPLPGMNYYRLKAVDYDGYTEYFPAISVYNDFTDVKAQTMISDYTLRIQNNIDCTARLTSLSGTGVFDVDLRAGTNELILPASLPKGIYALIILSGDNVVKRERVFVQ